jgi:hypothetical protein
MTGTFVGYDPGGNGRHGLAALTVADGRPVAVDVGTLADAEAVLQRVEAVADLAGVGVDTLTCWSTGPSGWRPADRWLRAEHPEVRPSVVSPNALYGSMGLSGMAVLTALRRRQPDLPVTETHPKVLHWALRGRRYRYTTEPEAMDADLSALVGLPVRTANDHEWDAAVSAYAAACVARKEWTRDLHHLPTAEGERLVAPCGPTRYAWPV